MKDIQEKDQLAFWQGLAENRLHVTLASEAEWEKAARGTDGRIYPWGNEFDPNKANMGDTGIGSTSTVGCFPSSASPYGLLDVSGNVYEWTRSLWDESVSGSEFMYPYQLEKKREDLDASNKIRRVVRGGSFLNVSRRVRCARRDGYPVSSRKRGGLGFRVVVSPGASL